jgi:hypothetical protein
MTIEIVHLPINSMVIWHSYVNFYQRVSLKWGFLGFLSQLQLSRAIASRQFFAVNTFITASHGYYHVYGEWSKKLDSRTTDFCQPSFFGVPVYPILTTNILNSRGYLTMIFFEQIVYSPMLHVWNIYEYLWIFTNRYNWLRTHHLSEFKWYVWP